MTATPVGGPGAGTSGLFLVAPAPNLVGNSLRAGHVVVFVPEPALRAGTELPGLRLAADVVPAGGRTVRRSFSEAGQHFEVILPSESVSGAGTALPWIVLACGLVLGGLAAALGVNAARRARAQDELDRIFTLSPDLIAVADFDGHFTRVNPAAEKILGRPKKELLERPYLEFVHPDDRGTTAALAAALAEGRMPRTFENRFIRADGSARVLEWTAAAIADEGVVYGVARDVTERRRAERELERLAGEQSALRRVATLVATGVPPADVFSAVADEVEQLLGAEATVIARLETGRTVVIVASAGLAPASAPVGTRLQLDPATSIGTVLLTGRSVRVDDVGTTAPPSRAARLGIRSAVAVPIMVDGALWGAIGIGTSRERFAADAEERLAKFTEGRRRAGPADARPPVGRPGPPRRRDGLTLPGVDRGRRVLRRIGSGRQRDQACTGVADRHRAGDG